MKPSAMLHVILANAAATNWSNVDGLVFFIGLNEHFSGPPTFASILVADAPTEVREAVEAIDAAIAACARLKDHSSDLVGDLIARQAQAFLDEQRG